MDAGWAIRHWCSPDSNPLDVLAERESIYHILGQTTPENLHKNIASYTVDPHTRYPNLNTHAVLPIQVVNLFDCDDKNVVEKLLKAPRQAITPVQDVPKKRRRKGNFFMLKMLIIIFLLKMYLFEYLKTVRLAALNPAIKGE